MSEIKRPVISLSYCTQCNWLLRTAWMAQELLSTFGQDIASVTLIPATGGRFQLTLDGEVIWDRKEKGGFPDVKVLKQMVRDRVWPDRDLGHIDRAGKTEG
jgi:selenoprotein W-related protein